MTFFSILISLSFAKSPVFTGDYEQREFIQHPISVYENTIEEYDKKVRLRARVGAFVRTDQCMPSADDFQSMLGLEYLYGCAFTYASRWYFLYKGNEEDSPYYLVLMNEDMETTFFDYFDNFEKLPQIRRDYPQFRGSHPKEWYRMRASALNALSIQDFTDIIKLGVAISEMERQAGIQPPKPPSNES
tara:strand:- start:14226 stop:14789 length:564 start_codon:yes stop_codon:yes gene_type:complete